MPGLNAEVARCMAANERFTVEYRVVWPDGSVYWIQGTGEFTLDSAGKPVRGRGVVKEITHHKRAEEERERLLAQEQRARADADSAKLQLANTLERINDAFAALDRNWRYTYVNEKAAEILGRPREELIGQHIWTLFPESVGLPGHLACERAALTQMPVEIENYYPPFDRWFANRIYPSPDGLTISFQDITPRKRAEEALQQAHDRLKVLSRQLITSQESERRHLARELHDEIGQVLTAVHLSLQQASAVSAADALPRLEEASRIVERAIGQVRTMSLALRPAMLDDFGLMSAVRWYVGQQAEGLAIELTIEDCGGPLSSEVSTTCYRIVQEGLTNVRRHARAKHAWVKVIHTPQEIHVLVRDDGVGFDAPTVWAYAVAGGTFGILGMQERVELLGGRFELRASPDHGTEVEAVLPLSLEGDLTPEPDDVPNREG